MLSSLELQLGPCLILHILDHLIHLQSFCEQLCSLFQVYPSV